MQVCIKQKMENADNGWMVERIVVLLRLKTWVFMVYWKHTHTLTYHRMYVTLHHLYIIFFLHHHNLLSQADAGASSAVPIQTYRYEFINNNPQNRLNEYPIIQLNCGNNLVSINQIIIMTKTLSTIQCVCIKTHTGINWYVCNIWRETKKKKHKIKSVSNWKRQMLIVLCVTAKDDKHKPKWQLWHDHYNLFICCYMQIAR